MSEIRLNKRQRRWASKLIEFAISQHDSKASAANVVKVAQRLNGFLADSDALPEFMVTDLIIETLGQLRSHEATGGGSGTEDEARAERGRD